MCRAGKLPQTAGPAWLCWEDETRARNLSSEIPGPGLKSGPYPQSRDGPCWWQEGGRVIVIYTEKQEEEEEKEQERQALHV